MLDPSTYVTELVWCINAEYSRSKFFALRKRDGRAGLRTIDQLNVVARPWKKSRGIPDSLCLSA